MLTGPAPEDILLTLNEVAVAGEPEPDAGDYEITGVFPVRWNNAAGTLTIPRGESTASFRIRANRDEDEEDEKFTLALGASSLPGGWSLSGSVTSGVITLSDTGVTRSDSIGFALRGSRVSGEGREHTVQLTVIGDVPPEGINLKIGLEGTLDDETDVLYNRQPLLPHGVPDPSITLPAITSVASAGVRTINFTISVPQDRRAELDTEVHFVLDELDPQTENGLPDGWTVGEHARHTVTISANDNLFSLREGLVDPVTLTPLPHATTLEEGGELDVAITIVHASPAPSSVELLFDGSGAEDGVSVKEAVAAGGTSGTSLLRPDTNIIDIPGGTGEVTVTLAAVGDNVPEDDENVRVSLVFARSQPHGWEINEEKRTLALTIPANDNNTVAFGFPAASSIAERASESFVVKVSPAHTEDIKVALAVPGAHRQDISISGDGYVPKIETGSGSTGGILTIPANEGRVELTITANGNDGAEPEERIGITLSPDPDNALPGNFVIGAPSTHTVTIPANDNTISITADKTTVEEEDTATLTVTANNASSLPGGGITVNLFLASTTDASLSKTSLTLTRDSPADTLIFTATGDDFSETNETISVMMVAAGTLPNGWSLISPFDIIIPANDNNTVAFRRPAVSFLAEGTSGSLVVNISPAHTGNMRVALAVPESHRQDISISGNGYVPKTEVGSGSTGGILTIPANEGRVELTITANGNDGAEPEEHIDITLSPDPGNALPGTFAIGAPSTHTVTIPANSDNTVAFKVPAASSLSEGASGLLVVKVSPAYTEEIKVALAVPESHRQDISVSGGGYVPKTEVGSGSTGGILTIPANEDEVELTITANGNDGAELEERIGITLSPDPDNALPGNVSVGAPSTHTVTIPANDNTVSITADKTRVEEEGTATLTVTANSASLLPQGGITVNLAVASTDASLSKTSLTLTRDSPADTLIFTATGDDFSETDEVVSVIMVAADTLPHGWSLASTFDITIPANDTVASITVPEQVSESDGMVELTVTVAPPAPAPDGVPLTLSFSGNEVSFEQNSQDNSVDISIPAPAIGPDGNTVLSTTTTVPVYINPDADSEDEEVVFTLAPRASGFPEDWGSIPDSTVGTLNITDSNVRIGFALSGATVDEGGRRRPGSRPRPSLATAVLVEASGKLTETVTLTLAVAQPNDSDSINDVTFNIPNPAYDPAGPISVDNSSVIAVTEIDVTLTPENPSQSVPYRVVNDITQEGAEVATFSLAFKASPPANVFVGDGDGDITTDDNTRPFETFALTIRANDSGAGETLSFSTLSASEINEGEKGVVAVLLSTDAPLDGLVVNVAIGGTDAEDTAAYGISVDSGVSVGSDGSIPPGTTYDRDTGKLMIRGGQSAAVFRFTAEGDADEENEVITLTLTADTNDPLPDEWSITGTNPHTLTFRDTGVEADKRIGFANTTISDTVEGGDVTLRVEAPEVPPVGTDLVVDWAVTTNAGDVSSPNSGSVTIEGGGSSAFKEFTLNIRDDSLAEDTEEIVVTLSENDSSALPEGYSLSSTSRSLSFNVPANENLVFFDNNANSKTVDEGDGSTTFNISLTNPAPAGGLNLSLTATSGNDDGVVSLVDGSAASELDIDVGQGEASHPVTVYILPDDSEDENETIVFTLTARGSNFPDGWGAVDENANTYTLTVNDDDVQTIGFAQTSSSAFEGGDHEIEFEVAAYTVPDGGFTLNNLEVAGDFTDVLYNNSALTGSLSVSVMPGATAQDNPRFTVSIDDDEVSEDTETVTFTLPDSIGGGFTAGSNTTHTLTIEPSDNTAFFDSEANPPQNVGTVAEDGTSIDLTVTLSPYGAPSSGLPLALEITSGNDANLVTFNRDGTARSRDEFTVPAGMTTRNVTVYVNDNNISAEHENIVFMLKTDSNNFPTGWGAVETDADTYTLTVTDDEVQTIGFAQTGSSAFEGDDHEIEFEVVGYTVPSGGFALGSLGVAGDLADVSYDNSALTGSLPVTVVPGTTAQDNPRFTVRINNDGTQEDTETVTFTLPDPIGGGLTAGSNTTHTLTIEPSNNTAFFDSEASPPQNAGTVPEDVGGISLTVTLSPYGAPSSGLPLMLEIISGNDGNDANLVTFNRDGTAQSSREFTVPAGMTTRNVTVYVNNNAAGASHEDVVFMLKKGNDFPDGWGAVDGNADTYTLTVNDDDRIFPFTFSDPVPGNITEGASTALALEFGNVLNAPAVLRINATGTGINGGDISITAGAGASFSEDPDNSGGGSLTIERGTRSPVVLTVIAEDDTFAESDEILTLALDETHSDTDIPRGWEIGASDISKDITILSNDNTATFATGNPVSVLETVGTTTLNIALTNPAPGPDGLRLSIGASGNTAAVSLAQGDPSVKSLDFTIPAGEGVPSHPITVYISDGTDGRVDEVTFTLTTAAGFPGAWGSVPSGETHALSITEPGASVGGTVAFTSFRSMVNEPADGETASHSVVIETTGTLPDTGSFNLAVNTNTAPGKDNDISTADADDYSVTPTLASIPVNSIGMISLDFSIIADNIPEADENIELTLSATGLPEGWNLGAGKKHTVTILANDSSVGFSAPVPGTLTENQTPYEIPVTLVAPVPQDMEFLVRVTGADHNGDSISRPASDIRVENRVRYTLGGRDTNSQEEGHQETVNIPVEVLEDLRAENEETFTIELRPIAASIPADFARDFVRTFDVPPHDNTVTFKDTQPVSVSEEGGAVPVELELTNPVPENYVVSITQDGGDALDLTIAPEALTINKGDDSASFMLTANDDADDVPETITLTLSSSQKLDGWGIPENTIRTVNIVDNDQAPAPTATVAFQTGASSVTEPGTGATTNHEVKIAITNTGGTFMPSQTLPVMLTVEPGQDVKTGSGGDVEFSGTLQFGETEFNARLATYSITVLADDEREGDETVTIRLTQQGLPEGWTLGATAEHIVTIPENDQPAGPTIGFADEGAVVTAPTAGVTSHNVPLALTEVPTNPLFIAFTLTTANGAVRGERGNFVGDYSAPAVHRIGVNEVTDLEADYPVRILGGTEREFLESFTIIFADEQPDLPAEWSIDQDNKRYRVTIPPHGNIIEFASVDNLTITELDGDSHSVDIEISINRPLPLGTNATVAITHPTGNTAAERDYTISGGDYYDPDTRILTLPEMEETVTLTIEAVNDNEADRGESFAIELTDLVLPELAQGGWTIGRGSSPRISIMDDDPFVTGTVGFANTNEAGGINLASVMEGGTNTLTVTASAQPETDIPVTWRVTDGAEDVEPDEGTVTISAGGRQATFDIMAISDNATVPPEVDEEIIVALSGDLVRGFGFDDSTHTFTIPANGRNTIGFAEPATAVVQESGNATLRLDLKNADGLSLTSGDITGSIPLTFTYTETDGENSAADSNSDTEDSSPDSLTVTGVSSIVGGILEVVPQVTIKDDNAEEEQETITVTLGMGEDFPVDWHIENDTFTIIIPANDALPASNKIGFRETGIDLYSEESQNVEVNESVGATFPAGISLVATIEDADFVSFGASSTQPSMDLALTASQTSNSFEISPLKPGGTTTITLGVAPGQSLPSGWGLDENRNVLTVNTYERLAGFAQSESETLFSAGTVRVRLDFGAPTPSGFTAEVTTTDVGTITLPQQPMTITQGVRFHEFDVTIVETERSSRSPATVPLRLESIVDSSGNAWQFARRDHNLKLLPPNLVSFDSNISSAEVHEDAGTFPVMLSLVDGSGGGAADAPSDFSVDFTLVDAAAYGGDVSVAATNTSPTFRTGEGKAVINLTITDDGLKEGLEEMEFTLSEGTGFPATGWEIGTATYTLSIIDNDGDAGGEVSFASDNSGRLVEGAGLTSLRLSLNLAGGGSATAPTGGIGLSLSSSDPGRVAIPAEWASFTIPAGTVGEITFMVDVLGDDGDTDKNNVTLTLKQGTDEAGTGFPSGWGFPNSVTELPLTLDVIETPRVGFASLRSTDRHFNNFDEDSFTLKVAESFGSIDLPIETSTPAPEGGLHLTVTIVKNDDDAFSFSDMRTVSFHNFRFPGGQTRHNIRIHKKNESGENNDETGIFRLSLGPDFPADIPNAVVTRKDITIESIDHEGDGGGEVAFEGPPAVEFSEPHDSEFGSSRFVLYDGHSPAFVYHLDVVFTALPRATVVVDGVAGFYLGARFAALERGGHIIVHNESSPLRQGSTVPDVTIPAEFFVPIHEIVIRETDYLYRLPIHVFRDLPGDAASEREGSESFSIVLTNPRGFPAGITRFGRTRQSVRIFERGGGQVGFVPNDTSADGEAFNRSSIREGESFRVRVVATSAIQKPTPLRWRIFRADGGGGAVEDFVTGSYTGIIEIPAGRNMVDFMIQTENDNRVEREEIHETYEIVLSKPVDGSFPTDFGRRIDPEGDRYTFTILDDDSTPTLGFAEARTEAVEGDGIITIPFSLVEADPNNNIIPRIPDGGICLILDVSGTATGGDVFHMDTSRSGTTTDPAPNCDSTRGTVNAVIGTGTIAEYIPGGTQTPSMRLRINDDSVFETGEEITFAFRRLDNGLPGTWLRGEHTSHTVAIKPSDHLISFAALTSSLTESTTDRFARPSQEVSINIIDAVPEEEIEGDEKVIRLQVDVATLNDTNMEDDVALSIAYHASSGIGLDATGILTIPANISEVPLIVRAVDDGINDDQEVEQVTITLTEIAESPLPTGWSIDTNNGNNVHTVSVTDDDDAAFVQLGEQYKDGYTVSEASQSWFEAPMFIEATQAAPPSPPGSSDGTSFAVRVELDENSPYYDYIGVSHADVAVDLSRSFAEQGLSRATMRFRYNETSRSVFFYTRDNPFEEGDVSISAILMPSGDLPDGWQLGERSTLTINITDNDGTVFFDPGQPKTFDEGVGEVSLYLETGRNGLTHYRADVTLRDGDGDVLPRNGEFISLPKLTNGAEYVGTMQADFNGGRRAAAVAEFSDSITPVATFTIHEDDNFTDEVITYELSAPMLEPRGWGHAADPLVWTFTIEDKDAGGWIEFDELQSSVLEGDADSSLVVIYLRQPIEAGDTKVGLTFGGDAVIGRDYTVAGDAYDADTGILTFPAGRESVALTVTSAAVDDDVFSGHKELTLELVERAGADELPENWNVRPGRNRHTVDILDNDLEIFFADATPSVVNEPGPGGTTDRVTVGIDRAPTEEITVRVSVEVLAEGEGRATLGRDFTLADANVTFTPSGSLEQTIDINITDDDEAEPDETFVLTLVDDTPMNSSREREGSGFLLGGNHTITILANDNTVGFVSGTSTLTEGDGTKTEVEVSVNIAAPEPITLDIDVTGTAEEGQGKDYTISSRELTIGTGEESGTITLTSIEDDLIEGPETIILGISGNLPTGWAFGRQTHRVSIGDNDLTVGFVMEKSEVREPDSGTTTVNVAINAKRTPSSNVSLMIEASSDTAVEGAENDYVAGANILIPAGATDKDLTRNIGVTIYSDDDAELNQDIILTLRELNNSLTSGGNSFSFGQQTHTLTILANDNTVSIDSSSADTLEEGEKASVFVKVDKPSPVPITLNVSTTSSSTPPAESVTDYIVPDTLTIGADSDTGTLEITGIDDSLSQGKLTLDLEFTGALPEGWSFINADGVSSRSLTRSVTITDDEVAGIGWTDTEVNLPHPNDVSGAVHTLTVNVDRFPSTEFTLNVARGGTATEHVDYFLHPGTDSCNIISIGPRSGGSGSLTCTVFLSNAITVGETIVLTIGDALGALNSEGLTLVNHTVEITIVEPAGGTGG